jgi:threonylcarbamoyladenosine tRNA methylthiotransferase MtaB
MQTKIQKKYKMSNKFPKTAKLLTIGCRLNQADSALLIGRLESNGCKVLPQNSEEAPELVIVNSCTVTAKADSKSRQAARKLRREYPDAKIIVTGCGAELVEKDQNNNDDAVDLWLPNPEKSRIISHIMQLMTGAAPLAEMCLSEDISTDDFQEDAAAAFPFKSRAFLKIQEGCDNFCSYCIVPYVRGRERSRKLDEVMIEFKNLLKNGFHEIVLTGVNVCAYDSDATDLAALLTELAAIEGDFRIRLSSTEPHPNNQRLLDVMAGNPKICRFLHLSLQHGSDVILRAMNRQYTIKEYTEFVEAARKKMPGIHIGTDIIVGFPGETDADFATEVELLKKLNFANIHLFTYSKRKGTPAAEMPDQIDPKTASRRFTELKAIADQSKRKFTEEHIGQPLQVLFERERPGGMIEGWSDNYLSVLAPKDTAALNELTTIVPTKIDNGGKLIMELSKLL